MVKCSFSGVPLEKGKGKMYVKKDGRVLYFVDSKAQKNYLKLGRKARKVTWTAEARKEKEAALHVVSQQTQAPVKKEATAQKS